MEAMRSSATYQMLAWIQRVSQHPNLTYKQRSPTGFNRQQHKKHNDIHLARNATNTPHHALNASSTSSSPANRTAAAKLPAPNPTEKPSAAPKQLLQQFFDAHETSRATKEQLEAVFDLELDEEEQEKLLDLVENPRMLYPLEGQTVLEKEVDSVVGGKQQRC
ncbi:MAG: hypothetical protein Q9210_002534 [Variospora velana]